MAPSFILQLPKNIDVTQIPLLFDKAIIEIEYIYINQNLEYYIIYCGKIAQIEDEELTSFYMNTILS